MKASATLFAIVASAVAVVQASRFDASSGSLHARSHPHAVRRAPEADPLNNATLEKRTLNKRCPARPSPSAAKPQVNQNNVEQPTGLINVVSNCGAIGATENVTPTSGPNGSLDWFNCGVDGNGWNPPYITVDQAITVDFQTALNAPNSAFAACGQYANLFEKYSAQNGIPAIMIASFAMQESGCVASTVGGDGSQGLMQLTWDKCVNAPGGNCQDPEYNIATGAAYFASVLQANGGSLLQSIGQYNGWTLGMTYNSATAAQWSGCCRCQNNLDYLQQYMNGWLQNINAYSHSPPLGNYFNLAVCSSQ